LSQIHSHLSVLIATLTTDLLKLLTLCKIAVKQETRERGVRPSLFLPVIIIH
jgi:hypothetical protein